MKDVRTPTPGRPADEQASPTPRQRFIRRALIMVVILGVASVPLLAAPTGDPGAAAKPTAAAAPEPVPAEVTAPGDAGVAAIAPGDGGAALPIVPSREVGGAPLEPRDFQCKPVKRDESVDADQTPVPLPPFSNNIFPCSRCHDKPDDFNETPRNLTLMHTDIKLNHGPHEQWCYGCHNPTNRDTLRLAGGREISFNQSYELCGQCHGEKLRDWKEGIHGRRRGCWNGEREYLLCVNCHNQHSPRFKPLEPKPRPRKPSEIQLGGE